jgi:hypothetical protein
VFLVAGMMADAWDEPILSYSVTALIGFMYYRMGRHLKSVAEHDVRAVEPGLPGSPSFTAS